MNTASKYSDCRTFMQVYRETLDAVETARARRQEFLETIINATKKKKSTVRNWGLGIFPPSPLEKEAISRALGIPVEELFPPDKNPKKMKQPKNNKNHDSDRTAGEPVGEILPDGSGKNLADCKGDRVQVRAKRKSQNRTKKVQ